MVDTPIVLSRIGTNTTDYAASPQYDLHAKVRNTQDRKCKCNTSLPSWGQSDGFPLLGSQEDQNKADADAKRKAMKELINTWQDRLQLISVIVSDTFEYSMKLLLTISTRRQRSLRQSKLN